MAYRVVEESSLTGLADAIREAGGTGESLLFPAGFRAAISNMGGSGGTLTVTAPAGVLVSVGKDGVSKTQMADDAGIAVFKGLESGTWTVFITNGSETASKTVEIVADYATSITFFAATISITYPAGSTCTATDGTTTLTAPDTGGTWDCVVPNAGTWTVTVTDKGWTESIFIDQDGQSVDLDMTAFYLFRAGNQYTERTGGWGKNGYIYYDSSYSLKNPTIGDTIKITVNDDSGACIAGTQKSVDVTNFNRIYASCESKSGDARLVITNSARNTHPTKAVANIPLGNGTTASIDLSGVSGNVYIAVVCSGDSVTPSASAIVNSIKLM